MKQYGSSQQEARDELEKQVENSWKDINQGFLRPVAVPVIALMCNLNMARLMDYLCKKHDSIGKAARDGVQTLLIDPIPV